MTHLNTDANAGHRHRVQEKILKTIDLSSLSDYELLEFILMKSIPRLDVKPLAKALLAQFGSLTAVLSAHADELTKFPHLKDATIALFRMMLETNRRMMATSLTESPVLTRWEDMQDYCCLQLQHEHIEKLLIAYLDLRGRLIRSEILQTGTIDKVSAYPREIVKQALILGANALIIAHNHPSGDVQPSPDDIQMTIDICMALSAVDIKVIDHLIIGPHRRIYSFAAHGQLGTPPIGLSEL